MKIIKAGFEIIRPNMETPDARDAIYQLIEQAGRTCYKSEDRITPESARKFVTGLIQRGHDAMLEHASMTVRFTVDRGVSHEIVRHRIASFAQESTRYCVAGDTLLTYNNPHVHMTIAELYENMVNSHNGAWKRIEIRQYDEKTGELCFSKPRNIYYNGKKRCIRIRTELGYELLCTPDHRILTPHGYVNAGDLEEDDQILVNGTTQLYKNKDWLYHQNIELNKTFVDIANEYGYNVSTLKKWARKNGIPKKGTGYFKVGHTAWNKDITDERQAIALRTYHHCGRRKEGYMKDDSVKYQRHKKDKCEICGSDELDVGSTLQVHHKDCDRSNNNQNNLITLCGTCHQRVHSKNLLTAYSDTIVKISEAGEHPVYDIEMDSDNHNFVANGIVVHNCNYGQEKFGKEITVIEPCWFSDIDEDRKDEIIHTPFIDIQNSGEFPEREIQYALWWFNMKMAEEGYFYLLDFGATPQEARSVLPNSLKTELVVTANMREWRHFFKLRAAGTTGKPHPQMAEVAVPLLKKCQEYMPELFGDIVVPQED